jgi:WhiB family transcriptional regulator, redox-sensing transcriptional regulator
MKAESWMRQAECLDADPEAFFPEAGGNGLDAKKICARCPVIDECLEYAVRHTIDEGIWGGTSAVQRQRMRGWRKQVA